MQNLKQSAQVYWNIRWLRRLVISAITLLLILMLIPVAIQYAISYFLKDQGATSAQVEDINLNLFSGTFELTNLTMQVKDNSSAHIGHIYTNLNMLDLISSKIVIDELKLEDVTVDIQRAPDGIIRINGLMLPSSGTTEAGNPPNDDTDSKAVAFAVNTLSMDRLLVNYQEAEFQQQLTLNELKLSDVKSWEPASTANLSANMTLNQSPVNLSAKLNLFEKARKFKGQLSLQSLAFAPYAKFYRDYLTDLQGALSLTARFDLVMDGQLTGQIENNLELANLDLQYQRIHQQVEHISWQGNTKIQADYQPEIQGQLKIQNSSTSDTEQQYQVASFSELDLSALQYNSERLSIGRINLQNYQLNHQGEQQELLRLADLGVEGLDFQPQQPSIAIKQVTLSQPVIQVTLEKDKKVKQLTPLLATINALSPPSSKVTADSEKQSASTEKADKQLLLKIDSFSLTEPGSIDFEDLSVAPNYKTKLTLNTLEVNNISSTEAADFKLNLRHADYTTIDIQGSGLLLDPTQQISMTAHIKQLDLPPITSYTSAAMGYGMKSGVIDSDIDLKILKKEINSLIDLKIDSIEVIETHPETSQQVTSASGMSIDLAVSTLKDDNNIIDLKLPIKGNLDEPNFDLSLIMNKALGKAMQSASLSYLKYALQPFGSLVTIFNLAKAAAEHIALPPVVFKANSLEMLDEQQDLLDKVVKVLQQRPQLKIKACGVSSLADQQAIKEQLIKVEIEKLKKQQQAKDKKDATEKKDQEIVIPEAVIQQQMNTLANERSARVKAYFLEKGNLKPERILNCLSSSNIEKNSQPTVDLQI